MPEEPSSTTADSRTPAETTGQQAAADARVVAPMSTSQGPLSRAILAIESSSVLFIGMNILTAGIFVYKASSQIHNVGNNWGHGVDIASGGLEDLLLIARNLAMTLSLVARRRSTLVATDITSVGMAHMGTWLSNFLVARPPIHWTLDVLEVTFLVGSLLGLASLGRSFGIIPANRGIRTGGLYRFVRHPIYSSYIFFDITYVVNNPCWENALVCAGCVVALVLRAKYEERVLRQDPAYGAYAEKTHAMFIPYLF